MSTQGSLKAQAASSPTPAKTPAKSAKPYGTAAAAKAKKTEAAAPPESVAPVAQDDTVKAIEKLEIKTKAVNTNNIARVANSQLTSNDEKLQPLLSLKTGKPIDKFPTTSKDIEKLGLTVVDAMLNALEAERTGNEAAKRERLRMQIGLKPNPA